MRSPLAHNPLFPLEGDVEVDETYIGGDRPGRNGRGVGKTGVAIAVERREKTAGSLRITQIPRATTAVLTSFIQRSIRPDQTTVFTDAWGAYKSLTKQGIDHRPRKGGHGRQALDILPWAHTAFGNLKTRLRGTFHGVSPKHLQRYLDEFSYRSRRWDQRHQPFDELAPLHQDVGDAVAPAGLEAQGEYSVGAVFEPREAYTPRRAVPASTRATSSAPGGGRGRKRGVRPCPIV